MMITDLQGNYTGGIPQDAVRDCSGPGDALGSVQYWITKLDISFPRDQMEQYLKEYGAWDDLQTADDSTLIERCFWTACCDLRESGEWFGLVH